MKKEKTKPLPMVEAFIDYFVGRAKRILRLKNADFESYHVNYYFRTKTIQVWFFGDDSEILAELRFTRDGRLAAKDDYRNGK